MWAVGIAVWDWRFRRVPNAVLLVGAVAGLGLLWASGRGPVATGWSDSLLGSVVGIALWLPGWFLQRVGAGDVKFAACIGLLLGVAATVEAMLLAAVCLGVMALAARMNSRPDARLPAAVALSAGVLVRLGWGPLWIG